MTPRLPLFCLALLCTLACGDKDADSGSADADSGTSDSGSPDTSTGPGPSGLPTISLDPVAHDFGSVYLGCSDTLSLQIENVGGGTLVVTDLELNTGSKDIELDPLGGVALPISLGAGDVATVDVLYQPGDEYQDIAYLYVTSNDAFTPEALLTQEGVGAIYAQHSESFTQTSSGATHFTLSQTALAGTVEVRVDGISTTQGWSLDSSLNAVVFAAGYTPESGSTVTVDYVVSGC